MSELNLSKWMSEFHAKLQGILSYTRLVRRCILLISVDISSTHHKKRMDTYLMPLLFCINIYTVFYNVLKVLFDRVTHYSTLKNCFMKQKQISERQKFNNKNKVCKILETFTEKDIQVLNRLISNKYDILWRWNKILFNYDFASRNIKQTMVFLRKLYDHFDVILSENVHHNY
ncbi:unnamed protein product [Schistosoma margrebowiei]|uniref:Uncharacterized protein n=1 Tax=Schistosoma margrebowiei TaxID=48269 RepID=A0AA85AM43_9TREM|nr:unnamed protein product [Schistosoma margrebowiei]